MPNSEDCVKALALRLYSDTQMGRAKYSCVSPPPHPPRPPPPPPPHATRLAARILPPARAGSMAGDPRPSPRVEAFEISAPPENTENGGCLGRNKHFWECDGAADGVLVRRWDRGAARARLDASARRRFFPRELLRCLPKMLCLLGVPKMAVGVVVMLVVTLVVVITTIFLLLEKKPGLRLEPDLGEDELVWFRSADDLGRVTAALTTFLRAYDDQVNSGANMKDCAPYAPPLEGETCFFKTNLLGRTCQRENSWGYDKGSPCVLITFDKQEVSAGWVPDVYTDLDELPPEMPLELRLYITNVTKDNRGFIPEMVWVSCTPEDPSDQAHLGAIEYSPWRGFPKYYFPIRNEAPYLAPIVAVQFLKPATRRPMTVECRAWSKNMVYSRAEGYGLVRFHLTLD
ncbi:sodium/potassium-transporting ATPase subunit beta-2 isoform X3 [Penaeus vannamei]|uniref:sodium/potassium-transporting ATPase subunit beta-2 isoform X3 n=1 Tax=Penaeus vannamei TaxID=6689 RepID=UPI00387F51BF